MWGVAAAALVANAFLAWLMMTIYYYRNGLKAMSVQFHIAMLFSPFLLLATGIYLVDLMGTYFCFCNVYVVLILKLSVFTIMNIPLIILFERETKMLSTLRNAFLTRTGRKGH